MWNSIQWMNWKEESGEILKYIGEEGQCTRISEFPNMSGLLCNIHILSFDVPSSAVSIAVSRMLSQDTALFRIQWNIKQLKVGHYMLGERFHVYMLSLCHKVSQQLTNSCQVFLTVLYIMHCMYLLRFNFTWVNFQTTWYCLFNQNGCCSRMTCVCTINYPGH